MMVDRAAARAMPVAARVAAVRQAARRTCWAVLAVAADLALALAAVLAGLVIVLTS